jgi:sugar (pentulose or hexulose) kinase
VASGFDLGSRAVFGITHLGVDVGTSPARAALFDDKGDEGPSLPIRSSSGTRLASTSSRNRRPSSAGSARSWVTLGAWLRIFASVLRPLHVAGSPEVGARGAVLAALTASGTEHDRRAGRMQKP